MPRISVIIPAYNAEPYLQKSIDSVLAQSFTDWELLLVDDGSDDGTPAICQRAAAHDSRVKALRQENAGVSAARNRGIEHAKGEYIAFLDADDRYAPQALQNWLDAAEKNAADMVEGSFLTVSPEGETVTGDRRPDALFTTAREALADYLTGKKFSCWNRLYRRDFIGETRFSPYTRGEDALFVARLLARGGRFASISAVVVYYLYREDSVTKRRQFNPRRADLVWSWAEIAEVVRPFGTDLLAIAAERTVREADGRYRDFLLHRPASYRETARKLMATRRKYAPCRFETPHSLTVWKTALREELSLLRFYCRLPGLRNGSREANSAIKE